MRQFLKACYYLRPYPPPSRDSKKLLALADVQDCIPDEHEDEQERYRQKDLKPRQLLNVNLTGRMVKRENILRSVSATKMELVSRRRPLEQVKLPVPQRPTAAVTCSYKLPTSLPCKVKTERPPSQSASVQHPSLRRTAQFMSRAVLNKGHKQDKRLPYRLSVRRSSLSQVSKSVLASYGGKSSPNDNRENPLSRSFGSLTYTSFHNGITIKPSSVASVQSTKITESRRNKQLQDLVNVLGESTLTPYLQRLTIDQGNMSRPVGHANAIDYNIVFGSRI